jgi:hypothetical protein
VLWFLIVFQLIAFLASELVELFQCIPVRAFWELVPGEKCNAPSVMWTLGYVYTGSSLSSPSNYSVPGSDVGGGQGLACWVI